MIDSYINIDKSHKSFDKAFIDLGLNKLVLKNITNSNQINLVVTSLAKYGETKKNLSDFESTNRPFPTLIIVDDKDFEQTIENKNGYITLNEAGLLHKVSDDWPNERPRVTIAFDFILKRHIHATNMLRWVPII